jgi:ankyrin repeat protein
MGKSGPQVPLWKPTEYKPVDPPLIEACKAKRAADALKILDDSTTDVNITDEFGFTPLHWACFHGDKFDAVADKLIKAGAKVNVKSKNGTTALIFACLLGRKETALKLVDKASKSIDAISTGGLTALDYAEEKGLEQVAAEIRLKGGKKYIEIYKANGAASQQKA